MLGERASVFVWPYKNCCERERHIRKGFKAKTNKR